jgi:hypothetical protein
LLIGLAGGCSRGSRPDFPTTISSDIAANNNQAAAGGLIEEE